MRNPPKSQMTDPHIAARMERLPVGRWHRKLTLVIGVGVFYEYFELFLGGVLLAVLGEAWNLSTVEGAFLVSSVFFGMFVGSYTLGPLADRIGRRRMFLVNLSIYLVFALLAAASPNVWFLIACRFVAGMGAGAEAALINTYLGEFIPRHKRGRYIGLAMTFGFLAFPVVSLLGAPLARAEFVFEGWRWLMIIAGSGIVFLLWIRRTLPESPRWLVSQGRLTEADAQVTRIEESVRAETGRDLPPVEEAEVREAAASDASGAEGWRAMLRGEYLKRMFMMSSLTSLGAIGYYAFGSLAPVLLVAKGFTITQSLAYTAVIALGYPLGTLLAAGVAERLERKHLFIASTALTALLGLAFAFTDTPALILLSGFALTLVSNVHGTAAHMYLAEVFPTRNRSTAIGLTYGIGRLAAAIMPFIGLPLLGLLGPLGVMSFSATLLALACVIVALLGPLTTGRSLETVTAAIARQRSD